MWECTNVNVSCERQQTFNPHMILMYLNEESKLLKTLYFLPTQSLKYIVQTKAL
jgi:hypothetical protein